MAHNRIAQRETCPAPGAAARPNVLLAIPSTGEIHLQTLGAVQLLIRSTTRAASLELRWENIRPVAQCRNRLVERFLADPSKTHLLFIDTDMVVPPNGLDLLLETGAPFVCGPAPICRRIVPPDGSRTRFVLTTNIVDAADPALRGQPVPPERPEIDYTRRSLGTYPTEPFFCDASGMSFCLIAREVLERMVPPWFDTISRPSGYRVGEDVYFCRRARDLGYRLLIHPAAMCDHIKLADLSRFEQLLDLPVNEPTAEADSTAPLPPVLVLACTRDQWLDLSVGECLLRWQERAGVRIDVRVMPSESPVWALARLLHQACANDPAWQRLLILDRTVIPTPDLLARLAAVDAPIVAAISRCVVSGNIGFNLAVTDPKTGQLSHPDRLPLAGLSEPLEVDWVDLSCCMLRRDVFGHVPAALRHAIEQPDIERAFIEQLLKLSRAANGVGPVVAPVMVERRADLGLLGLLQLKSQLQRQQPTQPAALRC